MFLGSAIINWLYNFENVLEKKYFYVQDTKINNNNCCKELFTSIKLQCSKNERD
tara:strand:+ start:490 stop:651 length:162 start_codon:yes stop_codon:yes gene_type:complete